MPSKLQNLTPSSDNITQTASSLLLAEIRQLIEETRQIVASEVNAKLTMLYWHIGQRIHKEILQAERAGYGQLIVISLAQQLVMEYGKGFAEKNLRRMIQFGTIFPEEEIVVSLIRQLSWTHFIALIPIKNTSKRNFYTEMCRIERWTVQTLRKQISSMLYERTALAKQPETAIQAELAELAALRKNDKLTPQLVFRDPYVLEFLNLNDRYLEKDLEDAIMRELEQFLLELGTGFSFLARQKRITIDDEDFYLDLLFYHRDLKRLVAIELKIGDFKSAYKSQMELYLRWLDKYERRSEENPPIGLILCAGKKKEQIELLELNRAGIHVAEYLTVLPPKKVLQEKLHKAIAHAKSRLKSA